MRFEQTTLPGVTLIEPETIADDRGHFARLYCPDEFARAGIKFVPTQTSLSYNRALHTLRGIHYCLEPEAKSCAAAAAAFSTSLLISAATARHSGAGSVSSSIPSLRADFTFRPVSATASYRSSRTATFSIRSTAAIDRALTPACAGTIRNSPSNGPPAPRSSTRATVIFRISPETALTGLFKIDQML